MCWLNIFDTNVQLLVHNLSVKLPVAQYRAALMTLTNLI